MSLKQGPPSRLPKNIFHWKKYLKSLFRIYSLKTSYIKYQRVPPTNVLAAPNLVLKTLTLAGATDSYHSGTNPSYGSSLGYSSTTIIFLR